MSEPVKHSSTDSIFVSEVAMKNKKAIAQGIVKGHNYGRKYPKHRTSGGYQDDAEFFRVSNNYAKAHGITLAELNHFFETGERPKRLSNVSSNKQDE